jgi:hypothetical protein
MLHTAAARVLRVFHCSWFLCMQTCLLTLKIVGQEWRTPGASGPKGPTQTSFMTSNDEAWVLICEFGPAPVSRTANLMRRDGPLNQTHRDGVVARISLWMGSTAGPESHPFLCMLAFPAMRRYMQPQMENELSCIVTQSHRHDTSPDPRWWRRGRSGSTETDADTPKAADEDKAAPSYNPTR